MTIDQLITAARVGEMTSSQIAECVRLLAEYNQTPDEGSVTVWCAGHAEVCLNRRDPVYYIGNSPEAALVAAYNDLMQAIAEERAA